VNCAVCGAGAARPKLRIGDVEILECRSCGVAFWSPPPDFRARSVYDEAYFSGAQTSHGYDSYADLEECLRPTFAGRLARVPLPAGGGRLLDVGTAFGFALDEARRAGWDALGVDVSASAARRGAGVARGRIAVADAAQLPFATASFDAVTLWDVLEHLPDPHAVMAEVARVLRPGGRLALCTGDVGSWAARLSGPRWHLYTLPEHLFFYTRTGLRRLLEGHGLQVESMRAESSIYTLGYLVERLRKTVLRRSARGPERWPGSRLRVPVNLFDIVTAHALRSAS
jgi:SAM-dependent methyltransferase